MTESSPEPKEAIVRKTPTPEKTNHTLTAQSLNCRPASIDSMTVRATAPAMALNSHHRSPQPDGFCGEPLTH